MSEGGYTPRIDFVPGAKPTKVSSVKNALESNFSQKYEHKIVFRILQEEFPTAEKRIYSSDKTMHIFGIEKVGGGSMSTTEDDEEKQHLKRRI